MSWQRIQTTVSTEPPTPPGSGNTVATTFSAPEMASVGAAGGVTAFRSAGASPAKPSELRAIFSSAVQSSAHIMRGDLEVAIRDMQRCRSLSWISDEMRGQLGRCLYELTTARRMCP
jgi:hypothetical protein